MLILEGADHLGKTTAAKKLVQMATKDRMAANGGPRWPIRYSHMSRPNDAFDFYRDYRDMISRYSVQDRFHIGALLWHEDKLTVPALRIVEGWLAAEGSILVVFYASNQKWYKEHLEKNPKEEMFNVDRIMEGNRRLLKLMDQKILRPEYFVDVSEFGWITDLMLEAILQAWYERLSLLERFK